MTPPDSTQRHLRIVRADEPAPRPGPLTYSSGRFAGLFDLRERTALVVGGGGGIGGAIAHALADFGARIAVSDINAEAAAGIAESCARPTTDPPLSRQLDITDPEAVGRTVAEIEVEMGRIDILINSAGINIRRPVIDYTPAEWRKIIDINLSGVFFVSQAVARGMLDRGYGRIVTLGSVSSLLGHPNHAPYAATKGGIAIMTKAMATEWAAQGVTVNAIGPAYTVTGLITELVDDPATNDALIRTIPMGRLGRPEDIVGAAVYLASDAASFVTGHTLYVDGGRTAD